MDNVWELISAAKKGKDPEKSLKILQKTLNRAEKDPFLEAACYLEMTPYYKLLGLHKKEMECLSKTEQLTKTLSPTPRTAALLSKLAGRLRQLGEYKKSLYLLKKALPLFENPPEKAAIFCNMGNCYYELNQYKEAIKFYTKAKQTFENMNYPIQRGICLQNIGNALREMNEFKKSLKYYEKALNIFLQHNCTVDASHVLWNQAIVYDELEQFDKALSCYDKALSVLTEENPFDVAKILNDKGLTLRKLTRYKEAFSMFESARKLLKDEMVSHHLLIDLNEGALLLEVGQHDKAQHTLESVFKRALQANSLTLACKAYWALGYMYEKEGQLKKAYYYLRKCLKLVEKIRGDISPNLLKMSFFSGIEDIYSEMVFLTCKMGMGYTAFSVLQKMKARTLTEQIARAEKSVQAPHVPVKISKLYSTLYETPATYEKTGETLEEITRLETEYAETVTRGELFQNKSTMLTPHMKAIQSQLTEREILIEYIFDEDNLLLFLVTPSSFNPVLVTVGNNLQEKIYEYLYRIRSQNPVEKLSQPLYNILINPVHKYLAEDSILHIIPYRELYLFPFHALRHEGFLAETYQFMYHPTSAMITKTPFSPEKILVVGNPDKDLKGVEEECTTISSIAKRAGRDTTLLLKENATKERFYQLYSDHDIIHIACHGVYDSFNPLRSGLKFFDGILTALEMHHLNLKGKLLVLGACGSGSVAIEKGSELLGITRALLCAGSSTVTSLWEVPDTASVIFWRTFYEALFSREEVPRALQRAQQFMISTEFSHPYFWAGYRIMG